MAAAIILSLPVVSCSSSKDYTTHGYRPYHERRNRTTKGGQDTKTANTNAGTNQSKPAPWVDEAWAKLDVKLTPRDNKMLYDELRSWLGTPYLYGGQTRNVGCDCSGLVVEVYKQVFHTQLERNTAKILENNCKTIDVKELKEGDLVFFITNNAGRISHVGIYLKDNKFVHSSSTRGVVVDDMRQPYYSTHFYTAARVRK